MIKVVKSNYRRLWCLSTWKKSTSLYFFLEIFQRNSELVILGNLGMSGHTQIIASIKKKTGVYLRAKNQFHLSRFPWDIARTLQTCYFGYFGNERLRTLTVIPSIRKKFWYLFLGKKLTLFPTFLGPIARVCELLFGGALGMPSYETQNNGISL